MNLIIVLDNVRSAFNVGSVFRTADGAGVDAIHLIGITPCPGQEKKLEKTSLSSLEFVSWHHFSSSGEWMKSIDQENSIILAVEEGRSEQNVGLYEIENLLQTHQASTKCIYIVFGHEINGVDQNIVTLSNSLITIPMYGQKNSLNVATCVGIVTYRIKEYLSKAI